MGLQELRRMAQEINLSATEASFEAVTTREITPIKCLLSTEKTTMEYNPSGEKEFDKMRETASSS
jgi:hypothetical protein